MDILIYIYLVFYFVLSKIRLDWAVLLLIAGLPTYLIRFQILGIPFTLLEGMILISFFVWLIINMHQAFTGSKGKKKIRYPFDVEIILLLIISFIAVGVAGFTNEAFGIWKAYFFEPVLFFVLFLNIFQNKEKRKNVYLALAISALTVSLFAIFQKFTGVFIFNELWQAEATRRVTSFFPYPNAVGLYLGPIVLILVGYLFYEIRISNFQFPIFNEFSKFNFQKIVKPLFIFVVIALSILSVYFAKSEGALVGIAAGIVVFGLFVNKKSAIATIVGIVLLSAGIYCYIPARQFAYEKIILMDYSGQIRRSQWKETIEMLKGEDRLIRGAGLTNYQKIVKPYHVEGIFIKDIYDPDFQRKVVWNDEFKKQVWQPLEIYLYPHNILLNFWVELGFLGMLLFIWIILKYFVIGIKIKSEEESNDYVVLGLISAMVVIAVHGIVDVPYFKNDLSVLFWLLVALISIKRLEYNKYAKEK